MNLIDKASCFSQSMVKTLLFLLILENPVVFPIDTRVNGQNPLVFMCLLNLERVLISPLARMSICIACCFLFLLNR